MDGSKKILIDFDIWNVEMEFACENKTSFKNWLRIRGQNGNNVRKTSHNSKDLMETMGENI